MIGIIPAAGLGTRFKEIGKIYPKSILPYKNIPILVHQILWLKEQGCDEIRLILNHQSEKIKNILSIFNLLDGVELFFQEEPNGLSSAVGLALKEAEDKPVLVLLGDLLVKENITDKSFFNSNFISVKRVDDFSR